MRQNETNRFTPGECWFDAPSSGTAHFFFVFAQVSRALQQALREKLPPLLFTDVDRYADLGYGYSMLVYRASRPYRPMPCCDFSYDLLDPESMDKFFRLANGNLTELLAETSSALASAGLPDLARRYHPRNSRRILHIARTQKQFRKPLYQMLVTESLLLHELFQFGGTSALPPRLRAQKRALVEKHWTSFLRHFCRSFDFSPAGPALMQVVTDAFLSAQQRWYVERRQAA